MSLPLQVPLKSFAQGHRPLLQYQCHGMDQLGGHKTTQWSSEGLYGRIARQICLAHHQTNHGPKCEIEERDEIKERAGPCAAVTECHQPRGWPVASQPEAGRARRAHWRPTGCPAEAHIETRFDTRFRRHSRYVREPSQSCSPIELPAATR